MPTQNKRKKATASAAPIRTILAFVNPVNALPIKQIASSTFTCTACSSRWAANVLAAEGQPATEPFCPDCGSEEVEAEDSAVDNIEMLKDEEACAATCSNCDVQIAMSNVTFASLDGSMNCTVCGNAMVFDTDDGEEDPLNMTDDGDEPPAGVEEEEEEEAEAGDVPDALKEHQFKKKGDKDGEEAEASVKKGKKKMKTRAADEVSEGAGGDEEDPVEPESAVPDNDTSGELAPSLPEAKPLKPAIGAKPVVAGAEGVEDAEDAEDAQDAEDDEEDQDAPMEDLDMVDAVESSLEEGEEVRARFIRVKDTIIAMVGDHSVATLRKQDVETARHEVFATEAYTRAIANAIKTVGLSAGLDDFGFKRVSIKVDAKRIQALSNDRVEVRASELLQTQVTTLGKELKACLGITSMGLNKGVWDISNPLKASMVDELKSSGVKNAERMVDAVFAKVGDAHHKVLIDQAFVLMAKPVEVRNELASVVTGAKYVSGFGSNVKVVADDAEEGEEDEGSLPDALSTPVQPVASDDDHPVRVQKPQRAGARNSPVMAAVADIQERHGSLFPGYGTRR